MPLFSRFGHPCDHTSYRLYLIKCLNSSTSSVLSFTTYASFDPHHHHTHIWSELLQQTHSFFCNPYSLLNSGVFKKCRSGHVTYLCKNLQRIPILGIKSKFLTKAAETDPAPNNSSSYFSYYFSFISFWQIWLSSTLLFLAVLGFELRGLTLL
jgi:hypothetical protein